MSESNLDHDTEIVPHRHMKHSEPFLTIVIMIATGVSLSSLQLILKFASTLICAQHRVHIVTTCGHDAALKRLLEDDSNAALATCVTASQWSRTLLRKSLANESIRRTKGPLVVCVVAPGSVVDGETAFDLDSDCRMTVQTLEADLEVNNASPFKKILLLAPLLSVHAIEKLPMTPLVELCASGNSIPVNQAEVEAFQVLAIAQAALDQQLTAFTSVCCQLDSPDSSAFFSSLDAVHGATRWTLLGTVVQKLKACLPPTAVIKHGRLKWRPHSNDGEIYLFNAKYSADHLLSMLPEPVVYFSGRHTELESLHQLLHDSNDSTAIVVYGPAGVGKSTLATEYARRQHARFRHILLINASTTATLTESYRRIASYLNIKFTAITNLALKIKTFLANDPGAWLVIVDNYNAELREIDDLLSVSSRDGRFIFTTRASHISPACANIVHPMHLQSLPEEDALQLLLHRLPGRHPDQLAVLADRLNGMPIALVVAIAFLLFKPDISVADFLANIGAQLGGSEEDDRNHAAYLVCLAEARNSPHESVIVDILCILCCIHSSSVPTNDLECTLLRRRHTQAVLDASLRVLESLSLVAFSGDCVSMTEEVQATCRKALFDSRDARIQQMCDIAELLIGMISYDPRVVGDVPRCARVGVHARHCLELLLREIKQDNTTSCASPLISSSLVVSHCVKLCWMWKRNGNFEEALTAIELALPLVFDSPDTLSAAALYDSRASVYHDLGRVNEASAEYRRALSIREQHCTVSQRPSIANTLNNLGNVLGSLGQLDEAIGLFERALNIYRVARTTTTTTTTTATTTTLDPHSSSDYVTSLPLSTSEGDVLNNLANIYDKKGMADEAIARYNESLKIRRRNLGESHPSVGQTLNNLGIVLSNAGRYSEALELLNEALLIREVALGDSHPATGQTHNNLANVYSHLEDYERAMEHYEVSLEIAQNALGESHPTTASTLNNLANVQKKQGKLTEALENYDRALKISEITLGVNHPSTAGMLNNKAMVYSERREYALALDHYNRALEIKLDKLGEYHPSTSDTLNNIAIVLRNQRKYDDALTLYSRSLVINTRTLGFDHPTTGATLLNMATTYRYQKQYDLAIGNYEKALAIFKASLGEGHPHTRLALSLLQKTRDEKKRS